MSIAKNLMKFKPCISVDKGDMIIKNNLEKNMSEYKQIETLEDCQ